MENNKIYNESCLDTLSKMDDASIDCVITSPPLLAVEGLQLGRTMGIRTYLRTIPSTSLATDGRNIQST